MAIEIIWLRNGTEWLWKGERVRDWMYLAAVVERNIQWNQRNSLFGSMGATVRESLCEYCPRRPETSVLYRVMEDRSHKLLFAPRGI